MPPKKIATPKVSNGRSIAENLKLSLARVRSVPTAGGTGIVEKR